MSSDTDGKRLSTLTRDELCVLLASRVKKITSELGSGRHNECTYTPDVCKVVEVLNGLMLVGQCGKTIETIEIKWKV